MFSSGLFARPPLLNRLARAASVAMAGLAALAAFTLTGLSTVAGLSAQPLPAEPTRSAATNGSARATVVAEGLEHPWALAFLPGEPAGRMLVTERPGRIRIVAADGKLGPPLAGVPPVHAVGQGGMLDVAVSPDYLRDRTIFSRLPSLRPAVRARPWPVRNYSRRKIESLTSR